MFKILAIALGVTIVLVQGKSIKQENLGWLTLADLKVWNVLNFVKYTRIKVFIWSVYIQISEAYLGLCQTSVIESFRKNS